MAATPAPSGFVYPGVLLSRADLDFVRAKFAAGEQPWKGAFDRLMNSNSSESTPSRPTLPVHLSVVRPRPDAVLQSGEHQPHGYSDAHGLG